MENKSQIKTIDNEYKSTFVEILIGKSERIVSAIYLVTQHIKDIDPCKWSLRKVANQIINDTHLLGSFSFQEDPLSRKRSLEDLTSGFDALISWLNILVLSKIISQNNANIISTELVFCKTLLKKIECSSLRTISLPHEFFTEESNKHFLLEKTLVHGRYSSKRQDKNKLSIYKDSINVKDKASDLNKDTKNMQYENKGQGDIKGNATTNVKDLRRISILDVLKSVPLGATIKDISTVVKDCSEKTIQRELGDMITEGILRKEGERRWSKYFII